MKNLLQVAMLSSLLFGLCLSDKKVPGSDLEGSESSQSYGYGYGTKVADQVFYKFTVVIYSRN